MSGVQYSASVRLPPLEARPVAGSKVNESTPLAAFPGPLSIIELSLMLPEVHFPLNS